MKIPPLAEWIEKVDHLEDGIDEISAGAPGLPPRVYMEAAANAAPSLEERFQLTSREMQVLHWLAQGKRDPDIAHLLEISQRTVGAHVGRILHKLGVDTRGAAALIAGAWSGQHPEPGFRVRED